MICLVIQQEIHIGFFAQLCDGSWLALRPIAQGVEVSSWLGAREIATQRKYVRDQ